MIYRKLTSISVAQTDVLRRMDLLESIVASSSHQIATSREQFTTISSMDQYETFCENLNDPDFKEVVVSCSVIPSKRYMCITVNGQTNIQKCKN